MRETDEEIDPVQEMINKRKTNWTPFIIQGIVLLLAAFSWTISQEHRYTSIEDQLLAARGAVQEQQEELKQIRITLQRIVNLQEFERDRVRK